VAAGRPHRYRQNQLPSVAAIVTSIFPAVTPPADAVRDDRRSGHRCRRPADRAKHPGPTNPSSS
jgi:hypothetical protein